MTEPSGARLQYQLPKIGIKAKHPAKSRALRGQYQLPKIGIKAKPKQTGRRKSPSISSLKLESRQSQGWTVTVQRKVSAA